MSPVQPTEEQLLKMGIRRAEINHDLKTVKILRQQLHELRTRKTAKMVSDHMEYTQAEGARPYTPEERERLKKSIWNEGDRFHPPPDPPEGRLVPSERMRMLTSRPWGVVYADQSRFSAYGSINIPSPEPTEKEKEKQRQTARVVQNGRRQKIMRQMDLANLVTAAFLASLFAAWLILNVGSMFSPFK